MDCLSQLKTEAERAGEILALDQQQIVATCEFNDSVFAEERVLGELALGRESVHDYERDWERQTNEMKRSILVLENEFSHKFSFLANTLSRTINDCTVSLKSQEELCSQATQKAKNSHMNDVFQLERDITEEHSLLTTHGEQFRKENHKQTARLEHRLCDYERKLTDAINGYRADCHAVVTCYCERAAVLTARLNDMKEKWDERPSRQCDLELIERQTMRLQTVNMQLESAFMNFKKCRAMLTEQEGTYNRQFGRTPAVGVFTPQCPH
jgi:hypothetical protein